MVRTSFEEAKGFLGGITQEDNVIIIHDGDPDGFCSGVIMSEYCDKKGAEVEHFGFSRTQKKLKDLNLKKFNKAIVLDLGTNKFENEMELLREKKVLYVDHHSGTESVWGENILEYRTVSGICTSRSAFELTGIKEWLAIVGAYSDAGQKFSENNEWFEKFQEKIDVELDDFKEKYIWLFYDLIVYFKEDDQEPFELIKSFQSFKDIRKYGKYWGPVEKEINEISERFEKEKEMVGPAIYFYFEPEYDVKSKVITIISIERLGDDVLLFANPRENGKISMSARCQSGKINVAEMLEFAVKDLENGVGGGHRPSAGAVFHEKDLEKFKENVIEYLESH